jgi:hypothetical protein
MVYDIASIMHLCCYTPIAITAFVLLEDPSDFVPFQPILVRSVLDLVQMIIEYGTRHPLDLQQDAETKRRP